jgi:pyruvate/2-oxoglutarate dehydrogenase complex dihydrolipoamide acyltransferase (E2) component
LSAQSCISCLASGSIQDNTITNETQFSPDFDGDWKHAVQVEDGVVVPVVRKVDQKPLRELIAEYDDLVDRARRRRLSEDDCRGGIATVTNFGTFGLTTGTPIPLPNETLILGLGAGVKKPVWSDQTETFLPATTADIFLTFDHRVVDGATGARWLASFKQFVETPEAMLL